jgi:formyltetrahydrofolate-dependent phosphoribosylglycinamide formyltransferase
MVRSNKLTSNPEKIIIYTDGGSRGNPGPSAAAFTLADAKGKQIAAKAFYLGESTNNVAEYTAVLKALEHAKQYNPQRISIFSDSELLVNQLNGGYKVKSENIRPLFEQVQTMLLEFGASEIKHITRDKNKKADELVNQALNLKKDIYVEAETVSPSTKTVRLGVLISGGGTTLINILNYINQGKLNAEIPVVISSRSTVKGVERAKNAGLNVEVIRKKDYADIKQFSKKIEEIFVAAKVDLVIQGGWLCLWKIPARYKSKVMNIHPALLPSFGGKGMWGHHVHEAVLKAGCKVSGCTVHFCNNEYDSGPIIVQRTCLVMDDDTPDALAKRVFEQECIAYPQAINLFGQGRIFVKNCQVKIK